MFLNLLTILDTEGSASLEQVCKNVAEMWPPQRLCCSHVAKNTHTHTDTSTKANQPKWFLGLFSLSNM